MHVGVHWTLGDIAGIQRVVMCVPKDVGGARYWVVENRSQHLWSSDKRYTNLGMKTKVQSEAVGFATAQCPIACRVNVYLRLDHIQISQLPPYSDIMANITYSKKGKIFLRNSDFCSDIRYEIHLELKYLKVSVQTLIWVCYGS